MIFPVQGGKIGGDVNPPKRGKAKSLALFTIRGVKSPNSYRRFKLSGDSLAVEKKAIYFEARLRRLARSRTDFPFEHRKRK